MPLPSLRPWRIEAIFAPQSPWHYVGYCLVAIGLNTISSWLGLWALLACAPFMVLIFLLMWLRTRRLAAARVAYRVVKQPPLPARGLILLVSPYDPRSRAAPLNDPEKIHCLVEALLERPAGLTDQDFSALNLAGSNLAPLLEAVAFHVGKDKLRDVWLITTETEYIEGGGTRTCVRGSEKAGALLEKYLHFKYAGKLAVHRDGLTVKAWDYASIWRRAEDIFRGSGYKEEVLLADVTGGTKMMSVALALACLPPQRKMQYMDTARDWQGQPLHGQPSQPVVIDVDPILYNEV